MIGDRPLFAKAYGEEPQPRQKIIQPWEKAMIAEQEEGHFIDIECSNGIHYLFPRLYVKEIELRGDRLRLVWNDRLIEITGEGVDSLFRSYKSQVITAIRPDANLIDRIVCLDANVALAADRAERRIEGDR